MADKVSSQGVPLLLANDT